MMLSIPNLVQKSLFVLCCFLLSSFSPIQWTAHFCKTASCSIKFPSDKIEEKVDVHTNKTNYIYSSTFKKQNFSLSCTIYNRGAQSTFKNPEQHILESFLHKNEAQLIEMIEAVQLGQWEADAMHYKIEWSKTEGFVSVIVLDDIIYKFEVNAPFNKLDQEMAFDFFKGFERS
jgi:hypothetical protein